MLILTRKKSQRIIIEHNHKQLTLVVYDINKEIGTVKLGFISDKDFAIYREEIKNTNIKNCPVFNEQDVTT